MKRDGLLLLPAFVAAPLLRRWHMRWGASPDEIQAAMPGDEIVLDAVVSTRAIDIDAPPPAVWPWLVQMGQDRAGFYSYDWLERLAGAGIVNSNQLVPAWQTLEPGDIMRTYRYIRRFEPLGWRVVGVEREQFLVVRSEKATWSWTLLLKPTGSGTRLVARTRAARGRALASILGAITGEAMHFVMEVGVLRGIKHRAERRATQ